ncbi:hypothetical protein D3C76_861140 [compost metagenome]
MHQGQRLAGIAEQLFVAAALIRQVPLQAAQAEVQGLGDALRGRLTIGQLGFQAGTHPARPGGLLELLQGAFEYGLVVLGQLRVGVLQRPLEILYGELQQILLSTKAERRAEYLVPGPRVDRGRAAQMHGERRIVAAQAVAAGAHVDRGEGIQRLGGGLGAVAGHAQAELVAVALTAQFQLQRIADHLVVTHDALEDFPQAGAGHQRIAQGMEGGGADVG